MTNVPLAGGTLRIAPAKSLGCAMAFGLPFALGGLLALFAGIKAMIAGKPLPEYGVPMLLGSIFTLAGIGIIYGIRYAMSLTARKEQLRAMQPDKPWLWRDEWAAGRIPDNSATAAGFFWFFALFWNAISFPIAWVVISQNDIREKPQVAFVLLFPLVGIGVLIAAIRATLASRKYGRSVLALSTLPGVIGRHFKGTIETRLKEPPPEGASVTLVCVNSVTSGSGKNRSTHERVVWQDTATVEGPSLLSGMEGLGIPVNFEIPAGLPQCDDSNSNNQIIWRLMVSASVPGVDYAANFQVPVFETGAPPLTEEERAQARDRRRSRARAYAPADPRVKIGVSAKGGTEFHLAPKQKFSSAVGGIIIAAIFWGVVWALAQFGAPIVFALFFSLFALLITAAVVISLFLHSSISVERPVVTIRHRILGLGPTRVLNAADIDDVVAEVVSAQSGKATSWEVKIRTADGKSYTGASLIPDQREAEWTAEKIRLAIKGP